MLFRSTKHSTVPFLIVPGPPRAGVISALHIDPTCRYMLSAAGNRGWEGSSTEVLIGYEIGDRKSVVYPECVRNLAPVQMGKDLGVRHRIRGVKIGISLGYSASVVSHK